MAGKQDYGTPWEFIRAVERRFGPLSVDLAAHAENAKCRTFIGPEQDSLSVDWSVYGGARWLNPPFSQIAVWAKKCAEYRHLPAWTLLLVPASIGSRWFVEHVLGKAQVDGIPRLTFEGESTAYPKDLMLCAYGYGVAGLGYWDWRRSSATSAPERTGT